MTAPERPENAVSRPVSASQAPEAPVGATVQDDWRAALAAQLEERFSYAVSYATVDIDWDEEADALLPTVQHLVAEELRACAGKAICPGCTRWLNARADRLDATPDHGKA